MGVLALPAATDGNGPTACMARGIQQCPVIDGYLVASHRDAAARGARCRSRGLQGAAHAHHARLPAVQVNAPIAVAHRMGLHDASVVDDRGQQCIPRRCGHPDRATIGLHDATVAHKRVQRRLAHRHLQQAVAGKVQGDSTASSQRDAALGGRDVAVVFYRLAHQGHVAALSGVDGTQVANTGRCAAPQAIAACEKI